MIVVETDDIYCIYVRTNRRVKWKYAQYGGRYKSREEAIEAAKQHMGTIPFEYLIESLEDGSEVTGFVNWEQKKAGGKHE